MDERDERLEADTSVVVVVVAALLLFILKRLELFLIADSLSVVNLTSGIRDFLLPKEKVDDFGWVFRESRTRTNEDFDEELFFPLFPKYPVAIIADVNWLRDCRQPTY